eukprot:TRINITY_DN46909_c0_g1_i1.p1 TRINITY_DN46909_c0_g1~~TRINITY_DN46909_c0_g1_i1.p1  ORF type:complete len:545 (+),score=84.85 TRINITY_DN46909_c0_g1_i1:44-1678(+)
MWVTQIYAMPATAVNVRVSAAFDGAALAELQLGARSTVGDVKWGVSEEASIPMNEQCLMHGGSILDDGLVVAGLLEPGKDCVRLALVRRNLLVPFGQLDDVSHGQWVQVCDDLGSVVDACAAAGEFCQATVRGLLGCCGKVVKTDMADSTVKIRGRGCEGWLPVTALHSPTAEGLCRGGALEEAQKALGACKAMEQETLEAIVSWYFAAGDEEECKAWQRLGSKHPLWRAALLPAALKCSQDDESFQHANLQQLQDIAEVLHEARARREVLPDATYLGFLQAYRLKVMALQGDDPSKDTIKELYLLASIAHRAPRTLYQQFKRRYPLMDFFSLSALLAAIQSPSVESVWFVSLKLGLFRRYLEEWNPAALRGMNVLHLADIPVQDSWAGVFLKDADIRESWKYISAVFDLQPAIEQRAICDLWFRAAGTQHEALNIIGRWYGVENWRWMKQHTSQRWFSYSLAKHSLSLAQRAWKLGACLSATDDIARLAKLVKPGSNTRHEWAPFAELLAGRPSDRCTYPDCWHKLFGEDCTCFFEGLHADFW